MKIDNYLDEVGLEPRLCKIPNNTPIFQKWNFERILGYISNNSVLSIADVGAGNGALTIFIKKNAPATIETYFTLIIPSNNMLRVAKENLNERRLDAKLIPEPLTGVRTIKDPSFDYIISNNAFHHESNKSELFAEMFRLLTPKGKLIYADFYNIPDKEFEAEKERIWKADPVFAQQYKDSADKYWAAIPKHLRKNHPFEHHLTFQEVRKHLAEAGFDASKTVITPSPMYYAIVYAEKPGNNSKK